MMKCSRELVLDSIWLIKLTLCMTPGATRYDILRCSIKTANSNIVIPQQTLASSWSAR